MISKLGRQLVSAPMAHIVAWVQTTGITPNTLSAIGFLLTGVCALLLAFGHFFWGGVVLFCAGFFDMLDGAVARATKQSSVFGAFIDSTLDRYSESLTLLALVFYYSINPGHTTELILIFFILVGSLMVSYVRARAESLNIECKGGMLQRPERVLLLIFGLVTGWLLPILWIQAVFTNISAVQRIYEVYSRTAGQTLPLPGEAAAEPKTGPTAHSQARAKPERQDSDSRRSIVNSGDTPPLQG